MTYVGAPQRKLIVCLDGTNNQIGVSRPTNVGKTFEMLKLTEPESQIAYYDPGVGTLPASTARGEVGRWLSRTAELAFGWGMRTNVVQAYTWLMQHYRFRDDIYVFGFSRGAYTARALVGMLNRPGLLRPGSENLVDYAVREYATNKPVDEKRKIGIQQFADAFCWGTAEDRLSPAWVDAKHHEDWHAVPVKYVGLWDTVQAAGLLRWGQLNWPFTHEMYNAERIRHAVSIDEWRRPYHEFLVDRRDTVEEAWFAGVHSAVGGTFEDCRLASIALKWVLDGVISEFLLREQDSYAAQCTVSEDFVRGDMHTKMGRFWALAGKRRRPIPDRAVLHDTVRLRSEAIAAYRPKLPAAYSYTDQQWTRSGLPTVADADADAAAAAAPVR